MWDFEILKPAIDAAFFRSLQVYRIIFENHNFIYDVTPGLSDSPDPNLGRTQGCWMWNASGSSIQALDYKVQVVIGPACTDDMTIVNELLTYYHIPCITGAANLMDSTAKYNLLTRFGFTTFDLWSLLVQMLLKYGWSSVGIIYDKDSATFSTFASSRTANISSRS